MLEILNYLLVAMIALGIALFIVGSREKIPFLKKIQLKTEKALILPVFLIIFGLSLLSPFAYPYIVYLMPMSENMQNNSIGPSGVTEGLIGRAEKTGKGLNGAVIIIPSIKLKAPVQDTIDKIDLQESVGHVPWTPNPWEKGNVVILGENYLHQFRGPNVLFSTLHLIKKNAQINIYHKDKIYKYTVTDTVVIDPLKLNDRAANTSDDRLTLVTCYPPGTQNKRFIVSASLDSTEELKPDRG